MMLMTRIIRNSADVEIVRHVSRSNFDAEIAAEVQNSIFFHTTLVVLFLYIQVHILLLNILTFISSAQ